jgi:hypothetical protein
MSTILNRIKVSLELLLYKWRPLLFIVAPSDDNILDNLPQAILARFKFQLIAFQSLSLFVKYLPKYLNSGTVSISLLLILRIVDDIILVFDFSISLFSLNCEYLIHVADDWCVSLTEN